MCAIGPSVPAPPSPHRSERVGELSWSGARSGTCRRPVDRRPGNGNQVAGCTTKGLEPLFSPRESEALARALRYGDVRSPAFASCSRYVLVLAVSLGSGATAGAQVCFEAS